MNCEQIEELLPAYALGALEIPEREEVEAHLDVCPNCTPLIGEYAEAAAALASVASPLDPPPSLRQEVFSRVRRPEAVPTPRDHTTAQPSHVSVHQRPEGQRKAPIVYSIAAGFGLALMGVLLSMVFQLHGDIEKLQEDNARLGEMVGQQREITYTLAQPEMDTMMLDGTEVAPDAQGMLVVNSEHTWALLVSRGLQRRDSMGYQLWLVRDGHRTNGGVFTVDEQGYGTHPVRFKQSLYDYSHIGVTIEPIEGSSGPTGAQVLSARIR